MTPAELAPLLLSLQVAALATLLSLLVGVPVAWLLARGSFRGRDLLSVLVLLPMVLPPTVLGYYLLLSFGRRSVAGRVAESVLGSPLVFTPAGAVLANGGRVLGVTAVGDTVRAARDAAYQAVGLIDWPEGFCRHDIAYRAL